MNFTSNDIQHIEKKGLSLNKVKSQIDLFKSGLPFVNLYAAAVVGNGVKSLTDKEKDYYIRFFENKRNDISILKFVPASGAATRMFKSLYNFIESYQPEKESINSFINKTKDNDLSVLFVGLEKLPFYQIVLDQIKTLYPDYQSYSNDKQKYVFVKTLLDEDQLNYGFYPKGLLPFHQYKDHLATAFEEHLFEAALYASSNQKADLHFTISERYKDIFDDEFKRIQDIVEHKTNTKFYISFSYQKESTDTISVTQKNELFRDDENQLLFRPSGHGALLENLNDLDADLIFIKNIDNVVVFKYEQDLAASKKMLAGVLLETQEQIFKHIKCLKNEYVSDEKLGEIEAFLKSHLTIKISPEYKKYAKNYQIEYLLEKLDRPIRVCGMVKNEGEPGGGPFWIKEENGSISLQIVESAQVNRKSRIQKDILKKATHFNPVDLICGIKNHEGKRFDLTKFVDPNTAFITMKTKNGKDIKALELPGLWNGAMARWNTIFVEVPLITFNPVKTVTDLLKPTHQIK